MPAARLTGASASAAITLVLLIAAAALSWAWLIWYPGGARMDMTATMGLSILPFLAIWVVMMVAMMAPTAAPMVLTFQSLQSRRTGRGALLTTWLFVAGYLLLWALSGIAGYAVARGAEAAETYWMIAPNMAARLGGGLLAGAGIYQMTPLKDVCLSACRTPVNFIMTSWRPGLVGAFRMGWLHGLYCFGCCWLLFVILFPLGMMNIIAMAAITLLILAEKVLPWGKCHAIGAGAVLILYGAVVVVHPAALPTYGPQAPMTMDGGMNMGGGKKMDMSVTP
jgi:predicted metal-binding membrane protein